MGCICSFLYKNKNKNTDYNNTSINDTLSTSLNDRLLLNDSNEMFYDNDNNRISYEELLDSFNNYKKIEQKLNILEINTQENIKALSKDIHDIYNEFQDYTSNHQLSSRYGG